MAKQKMLKIGTKVQFKKAYRELRDGTRLDDIYIYRSTGQAHHHLCGDGIYMLLQDSAGNMIPHPQMVSYLLGGYKSIE